MKTVKLCFLLLIIPAFAYAFGFGGGGGGRGIQTGTAGNYGLSMADNGNSSFTCGDSIGHLFWESGVLKFCDPGSTTKILAGGGSSLPSQTGNSGKYLTTNGTAASWGSIAAGSGITMSVGIPTDPGAAYLNDSTHVLTVASTTGYTQFTGSYTAWDTTPAAFAFADLTDVALSTTQTATPVQVTGINYPTAVTASGGTAAICTGATVGTCGTFSASPGNIVKDQYVSAQHTSSGSNSTAVNTVVTIGGESDSFTSTTAAGSGSNGSDSFAYSDGSLATVSSGSWATPSYAQPFNVSSGHIVASSSPALNMAYRVGSFTDNQCSSVKVYGIGSQGPAVRVSSSVDSGYWLNRETTDIIKLFKRVSGTETQIGSNYDITTSTGDVFKICVSGSTITPYVNGTAYSTATDSAITSGNPGVRATYNDGGQYLDDWEGDNL